MLDTAARTVQAGTAVKDLGIHLDGHLTSGTHVHHLFQQMCGILTYLSRAHHFLTEEAINLLVQGLVICRLDYCFVVWLGIVKTHVCKLQRVINFAARVIYGDRKSDPVTLLLKRPNRLTVKFKNRPQLNTACFM